MTSTAQTQTSTSPEVLKTWMAPKNGKLNRDRGLAWEDELTKELNESRFMYCYNLGGSTHQIPDIFVMADNYVPEHRCNQLTVDKSQYRPKSTMITGPFVMAVECKYSTDDKIIIPKVEVDKCFEFLGQLSRYERFVLLAFKFKNKSKPIKLFTLIKYDTAYVVSDYDFFMMDRDGVGAFYHKGQFRPQKPPTLHAYLSSAYVTANNVRIQKGKFNLDSA